MFLSIIAAMDRNRLIGAAGGLPWHLPADLRHFRRLTLGKPVLMGRRTHESIGRPLPQRLNLVLTRDRSYAAPGCMVAPDLPGAMAACGAAEELMIIGGASLYRALLPRTSRMYLTLIEAELDGDTYFPEWAPAEWRERERSTHLADEESPYPYSFVLLDRIREPGVIRPLPARTAAGAGAGSGCGDRRP